MRAPGSPFERCMWERILSFACFSNVSLSFRAQSAKKECLRFAIFNFSDKLQNIFEIGLKKYGVFVQKSLLLKNFLKEKIRRHVFVVYVLIYPLSKFGGNRTNSLWVLAFYSCVRFKWKNWFEKTALNMSIRRVIFTSGQNLKPSFLCQYLMFFNNFFFYIRDFIWIITLTEKWKFEDRFLLFMC